MSFLSALEADVPIAALLLVIAEPEVVPPADVG
jgi:hypothetical protein